MSQPEWPLPIGSRDNGQTFIVHKNLMVAIINAVGGALVFSESDMLKDYSHLVLQQFIDPATQRMTIRVVEIPNRD